MVSSLLQREDEHSWKEGIAVKKQKKNIEYEVHCNDEYFSCVSWVRMNRCQESHSVPGYAPLPR